MSAISGTAPYCVPNQEVLEIKEEKSTRVELQQRNSYSIFPHAILALYTRAVEPEAAFSVNAPVSPAMKSPTAGDEEKKEKQGSLSLGEVVNRIYSRRVALDRVSLGYFD